MGHKLVNSKVDESLRNNILKGTGTQLPNTNNPVGSVNNAFRNKKALSSLGCHKNTFGDGHFDSVYSSR